MHSDDDSDNGNDSQNNDDDDSYVDYFNPIIICLKTANYNGWANGRMSGRIDQLTDKPAYGDVKTHLKELKKNLIELLH